MTTTPCTDRTTTALRAAASDPPGCPHCRGTAMVATRDALTARVPCAVVIGTIGPVTTCTAHAHLLDDGDRASLDDHYPDRDQVVSTVGWSAERCTC